jgi:hypothetical protein
MNDLTKQGFCVVPGGQEVLEVLLKWGGAKNLAGKMEGLPGGTLEAIFQAFNTSKNGRDLVPDTQHDQRRMLMLSKSGKLMDGPNDLGNEIRLVSNIV